MPFREKAQIMKKTGMKRVLLLGSGYVSGPVVEYLTRDERTQVTVGEFGELQVWYWYFSGLSDLVESAFLLKVLYKLMLAENY